jgi:hypothetical protein
MKRFFLLFLCAAAVPLGAQTAKQKAPAPKAPAPKAAAPAPAPQKELPVPFKVGETLEYDVGWSSYVTAGTATLTVKEKKPSYGSTAYYIVAEGRPTPLLSKLYTLYYKSDTLMDVYSLLPQRGSLYSEEGKRRRMKTTLFDQKAKKASYQIETKTAVKNEFAIPAFTQDSLSAVYVLRSIPFKPGEKFTMPVAENGKIYKLQMQVGTAEPIKTGIGTVNGLKITPVIAAPTKDGPRAITLWISEDARRLPLKIEAQLMVGKFTITLSKAAG